MHLIWSCEVKCVVTVWFLWSFWYILSNGVGDVTNRWRHFWFTSQHQSDLKYITHNSGSHYCFYYRSHQHTRTRNKNIYTAIKDYPQIRVWSYLPQVVHSFREWPIYIYIMFNESWVCKHLTWAFNCFMTPFNLFLGFFWGASAMWSSSCRNVTCFTLGSSACPSFVFSIFPRLPSVSTSSFCFFVSPIGPSIY